jgi:hypothetical protein
VGKNRSCSHGVRTVVTSVWGADWRSGPPVSTTARNPPLMNIRSALARCSRYRRCGRGGPIRRACRSVASIGHPGQLIGCCRGSHWHGPTWCTRAGSSAPGIPGLGNHATVSRHHRPEPRLVAPGEAAAHADSGQRATLNPRIPRRVLTLELVRTSWLMGNRSSGPSA